MIYIIFSKVVCVLHLLFPFYSIPFFKWIISEIGITGCATQWLLAILIFLVLAKGVEIFPGNCPFTLAEKWLMTKGGLTPYEGDCLSYYVAYIRSVLC